MSVWDVTITAAGLGGAAPADGFIDSKTTQQYMDINSDAPTTVANATAKSRANVRFRQIMNTVNYYLSGNVTGSVVTGGAANTAPSTIKVTITLAASSAISTPDENNAGATLTGAAAIKRVVARALILGSATAGKNIEIYNPDTTGVNRMIDGVAPSGSQIKQVGRQLINAQVGALAANITAAEAAITAVTQTS